MQRILALALALCLASKAPAQGRVEQVTVHSALYGDDRTAFVYTPPTYDAKKPGGYALLVTFDGTEYRSADEMAVPQTLYSLLAARAAPPFVEMSASSSTSVHSRRTTCSEAPGPCSSTNRRFRDALTSKGYLVDYTEVAGGVHAMKTWRPRFAADLVAMASHFPAPGL